MMLKSISGDIRNRGDRAKGKRGTLHWFSAVPVVYRLSVIISYPLLLVVVRFTICLLPNTRCFSSSPPSPAPRTDRIYIFINRFIIAGSDK